MPMFGRASILRALLLLLLLVPLAFLGIGCEDRDSVAFYNAPKDPPPTTAPVRPVADVHGAGGAGDASSLHWDAPKPWKEMPAGQMRVAQFRVNDEPPVDVTVIPLGPESGALLPNVNRWERELALPPSPQEKLNEVTRQMKVGDLDVTMIDLKGAEKRTLAAIVPFGGRVWFFKLQGPNEVVAKQQENFDAFIKTLHPAEEGHGGGGGGGGHAAAPAPADADHAVPAAPAAPVAGQPTSKLTKFTAPDGWKELPDSKPPRMLAFDIGSGEKAAQMIGTRFAAGSTGSFADNITRWRNQIGLPPLEDPTKLPMKDVAVGAKRDPGMAIEMNNPDNKKGVVVVIAGAGNDLWFFKMTGPTETLAAERAKFDEFIKSLEFDGGK